MAEVNMKPMSLASRDIVEEVKIESKVELIEEVIMPPGLINLDSDNDDSQKVRNQTKSGRKALRVSLSSEDLA